MVNIFGHKNNVVLYNSNGVIRYTYRILEKKIVEIFYNDDGVIVSEKEYKI